MARLQTWPQLRAHLDLTRLTLLVESVLNEDALRALLKTHFGTRTGAGHLIARPHLVAEVAETAWYNPGFAGALVDAMQATADEVTTLLSATDDERLHHVIVALAKELGPDARGVLIWALLREARALARDVGTALLGQFLDDVVEQWQDPEPAQLEPDGAATQERAAATPANAPAASPGALEETRRALRIAAEQNQALERRNRALRKALESAEAALRQADSPHDTSIRAERDALRKRVARLEHENDGLRQDAGLRAQVQALRGQVAVLGDAAAEERLAHAQAVEHLTSRERAAQARADSLRTALQAARRRAAQSQITRAARESDAVGVFIDGANLEASAREARVHLDYRTLLDHVIADRARGPVVAYVVKGGARFDAFVSGLRRAGVQVRVKRKRVRSDGSVKADWDMGIAMDVLERAPGLGTVVLCSGDGDFAPLFKRLKRDGCAVEVAAFPHATEPGVLGLVDVFHDLSVLFSTGSAS